MKLHPTPSVPSSVRDAMKDTRDYNRNAKPFDMEPAYSKDTVGEKTFRNPINRRFARTNEDGTRENKENMLPPLTAKC